MPYGMEDTHPSIELKRNFVQQLQKEILLTLSDNLIIMSTALASAIILLHRKVGIDEKSLHREVVWLYKEIEARGGLMCDNVCPSMFTFKTGLKYLSDLLEQRVDVSEFMVKPKRNYKNILMLSYYRNTLSHIFINESYIACSLAAFGESINGGQGVKL
jgi:glycerol-3-phosphate O-acyltransferase